VVVLQEVVLGVITDMFSFEKARYTTVNHLSEDILKIAKSHIDVILNKLTEDPP